MLNYVAKTKEVVAFVKKETSFGVFAFPASTNALAVLEVPTAKQSESFSDSKEAVNSRSLLNRFRDQTPAGDWGLKVYMRPSGAAGTAPTEDVLNECAFGKKTVNAGVSVVYEPAMDLPSFSMCFREGHTVHYAAGCMVKKLGIKLENKGAVALDFSGSFRKVVRAGTEETVAASTTTVLKLAAGGAQLYQVDAYVQVGTDDNTAQGYQITAVDTALDTITITPALSQAPAAGVVVKGFLPTPTLAGSPAECRGGTVTIGGAELRITSADLSIENTLSPDDAEVAPDEYLTDILEGARAVKGGLGCRFRRTYASYFAKAKNQVEAATLIQVGTLAGKRAKFEMPRMVVDTPEAGGDDLRRNLTINVTGLATVGEDEAKLTYF
jgi:hypothetical protein